MIHIDFQGGAHGNYLEFICNTIHGVTEGLPFNSTGASHAKKYTGRKLFDGNHYSYLGMPIGKRVVSIQINQDDLLPLCQVSLLRANDYGYDNNYLEVDTYNKLNTQDYRWVLDLIIDGFFKDQIHQSYNNVKDPAWPDIQSIEDYNALPAHIRQECEQVHKLELRELSADHPDCPRSILREFFQIGFEYPEQQGFMHRQNTMLNYGDREVYVFPFSCFYNIDQFMEHVKSLADWSGMQYNQHDRIVEMHQEFLKRQPYVHSKTRCDAIVQDIIHNRETEQARDLLEEAYINAQLKKHGHECRY